MLAQPPGEGVGLAVGEQVHRAVGVHVDQHRAVHLPAAQREVVHPEHRHRPHRRVGQPADHPQQGGAAGRQPQPGAEPSGGAAGQRQPDRGEHPAQPDAAPGIPAGQPRDLLGEGPLRTIRGVAEQPPDPEGDRYRCPADRGVGHPTSVAAVHPRRTRPAPGTAAFPPDRGRGDHAPGPPTARSPRHAPLRAAETALPATHVHTRDMITTARSPDRVTRRGRDDHEMWARSPDLAHIS